MKRVVIVILCVLVPLALGMSIGLSRRFHLIALTPAELSLKALAPPLPPDDSCDRVQRALAQAALEEPIEDRTRLDADEVAIYNAVISLWNSNSRAPLNVSHETFPIDRERRTDCECLKDIEIESLAHATNTFHKLPRGVLSAKHARLVYRDAQSEIISQNNPEHWINDPAAITPVLKRAFATGLFSLSEIAFDKEHQRALVGYSFQCGMLCGSGGTWKFERINGEWKRINTQCGGWVS